MVSFASFASLQLAGMLVRMIREMLALGSERSVAVVVGRVRLGWGGVESEREREMEVTGDIWCALRFIGGWG